MKKLVIFITTLLLIFSAIELKAQIVYQPFMGGGSSSQSTVQSQRFRATAYSRLSSGQYAKLPIVVEQRQNGLFVVQYYQAPQSMVYGSNGTWVSIHPAVVQRCYPDLSSNPLERSYMYKANINGRVYYFDL